MQIVHYACNINNTWLKIDDEIEEKIENVVPWVKFIMVSYTFGINAPDVSKLQCFYQNNLHLWFVYKNGDK